MLMEILFIKITGIQVLNNSFIFQINILFLAWIEGAAIFIAVFVVAFVGSFNDYKKEEQFMAL